MGQRRIPEFRVIKAGRERLARFPINVRYPRDYRDSVEQLRSLPIVTDRGQQITLSDVARLQVVQGPPMLRSENARLSGWVYVDIRGRDLRSAVQDMQAVVENPLVLHAADQLLHLGGIERGDCRAGRGQRSVDQGDCPVGHVRHQ